MTQRIHRLALMVAALWWGGISALAWVAVPMLFALLGSPVVAGPVAASLFSVVCLFTAVGGGLLLIFHLFFRPAPLDKLDLFAVVFLIMAMLAAGVQNGWVADKIVTARATGADLKFWHRLGSGLVLMQWTAAAAVLWRLTATAGPPQPVKIRPWV